MDFKNIAHSGALKKIVYSIAVLILLLVTFQIGEYVGFKKAAFSDRIGADYFRQISGRGGLIFGVRSGDFENAHGVIGKIISMSSSTMVVEDHNGLDKTVVFSTSTDIHGVGDDLSHVLQVGDVVVVFGSASSTSSVVDARLIRILPPPPQEATDSLSF